jgi:two-component system sensor histidine kinase KdpD
LWSNINVVHTQSPADLLLPPVRPDLRSFGTALLSVGLATLAGFLICPYLDLADVAMLYILCITAVATLSGKGTALLASVLSVLCLDFFFIPPVYTLAVRDIRHVGTFAVMLGVGWVVATLAERIRAQTRLAQRRERHTGTLYRLGMALAEGGDAPAIQERVEAFLWQELGLRALVLRADAQGRLQAREGHLDPEAQLAAQWALDHGAPAGRGSVTYAGREEAFLPMAGTESPVGVLVLGPGGADSPDLALALAAQLSLGLERARLAEERTEARIRAEHEQLKNTLLSSVSHDLRTPLGTITGATTTLLDPGPETRPGDQRLLLVTIHQEACRLERLVNNLLDLTKLEGGRVQLRKEWVPLEEVVGSAVSHLEEQLGDRPLRLRIEEGWAPLDPVLIEQALVNLLDNALKFSPPGSPLEIRGWVAEGCAQLQVTDEGPGFGAGEEERVFEKLVRGSGSPSVPGAGLGLAICRGIAQAHGGSIRAASGPGGGAQVTLTLPIEGTPPVWPQEIES